MKTAKLFVFMFFLGLALNANAQDKDKPAAGGYIPGKESNENQGRGLKEIERQEKEAYDPKGSPSPSSDRDKPEGNQSDGGNKSEGGNSPDGESHAGESKKD